MPTLNGRQFRSVSATFTRPGDTTPYNAGDLVANNTAAGSVVPLSWAIVRRPQFVSRVRLLKSTASVTNAAFRVHLFAAAPTFVSAGDNGAFATVVATGAANWIASLDGTMAAACADGAIVNCIPTGNIPRRDYIGDVSTLYGLVEALGAYTPGNAEIFTATLVTEFDQ